MSSIRQSSPNNQSNSKQMGHLSYAVVFLVAALVIALLAALFGVASSAGAALTLIALCSLALGIRALVSGR